MRYQDEQELLKTRQAASRLDVQKNFIIVVKPSWKFIDSMSVRQPLGHVIVGFILAATEAN
jgi:hypothetical protein